MNGDAFSIKAPKNVLRSLLPPINEKVLTRENVLRIFFFFSEDFGAPL